MRITNRSVLSLAFLLAAGALVAFGVMGCQPESTGGSTPPPKPKVDLPDAPSAPAAAKPEAVKPAPKPQASKPAPKPKAEKEVPPVDPKKTLFGVTFPEGAAAGITAKAGEEVQVRGYYATDWKPSVTARLSGKGIGVRLVKSATIDAAHPTYTNKGVWMVKIPADRLTASGDELTVSFRGQERAKVTIKAE